MVKLHDTTVRLLKEHDGKAGALPALIAMVKGDANLMHDLATKFLTHVLADIRSRERVETILTDVPRDVRQQAAQKMAASAQGLPKHTRGTGKWAQSGVPHKGWACIDG